MALFFAANCSARGTDILNVQGGNFVDFFACNGDPRRHFASTGQKNPFSRKISDQKIRTGKEAFRNLALCGSGRQISNLFNPLPPSIFPLPWRVNQR